MVKKKKKKKMGKKKKKKLSEISQVHSAVCVDGESKKENNFTSAFCRVCRR